LKLKFKATKWRREYWSQDYHLKDGDIIDVPPAIAKKFLKHFKDNFLKVDIPTPSVFEPKYTELKHKPLTLADISIVVLNPYPDVFKTHLLPCIPKEVEFIPLENINNINWTSGAKALNYGISVASNDIVMCCHPDLVLDQKWFENFIYHEARLKNWGALGVVGWDFNNRMFWGNEVLSPYKVQCLDECCVIVNRQNGIWFDEETFRSWHCFASDFCLQCINKGLDVYVMPGVANHEGFSFKEVAGFRDERDKTLPTLWKKWKNKVQRINMGIPYYLFEEKDENSSIGNKS